MCVCVEFIRLCLAYRISAFKMIVFYVAVEVKVRQLPGKHQYYFKYFSLFPLIFKMFNENNL